MVGLYHFVDRLRNDPRRRRPRRRSVMRRGEEGGNSGSGHGRGRSFGMHSLADLSLPERIALYTTTFEKHGHQVTLQRQHFSTAVHNNNNNNNNNNHVKSSTSQTAATAAAAGTTTACVVEDAVDVDVELGPPDSQPSQREDEDDEYNANSSSNIVHKRRSGERHRTTSYVDDNDNADAANNNKEEDGTQKDLVLDPHLFKTTCDSQCIICLEDFVIEDTIVYSENATCQHIFHKACMVQYLANNAQRTKSLRTMMRGDEDNTTGTGNGHGNHETTTTRSRSPAGRPTTLHTKTLLENPCPTCRQPQFCHIREGELRKALRKKNTRKYSSTTITTKEDTTTTTTTNNGTTTTTIAIDRSRFDR